MNAPDSMLPGDLTKQQLSETSAHKPVFLRWRDSQMIRRGMMYRKCREDVVVTQPARCDVV